MLERRAFFRQAGLFTLGTVLLPGCDTPSETNSSIPTVRQDPAEQVSASSLAPIGLQLYSVKDLIEEDLRGTLQRLADIGYKEVESYPGSQGHYFGMEPEEFALMLKDMGMELVSSHFGSGRPGESVDSWRQATLLSRFEELVEKAAQTGQQYLTCSSLQQGLRSTPEELERTAELFNKAGDTCRKAGLEFAYHNHAFEFEQIGDVTIYDYLLEKTDSERVSFELDMYWVVAGGKDPIYYLKNYLNRFPMGHVKDMDGQDPSKNAILGQGTIDYDLILEAAEASGMRHYLVEQETFGEPVLEAMEKNYDFLAQVKV